MKKGVVITLIVVGAVALGGAAVYGTYRVVKGVTDKVGSGANVIVEEIKNEIENDDELNCEVEHTYSKSQLEQMALDYYEKLTGYRPSEVSSEINEAGELVIQLYDSTSGHNSTSDWYTIDMNTGKGTNILGEAIDLTQKVVTKIEDNSSISDKEAKSIGDSLYTKALSYYWGDVETNGNTIQDGMYMEISNISDVKNTFSTQGFKQYMETNGFVQEIDGKYYRVAADRGGDISYLGREELKIESTDENKIVFTATEKYAANEDDWGREEYEVTDITRKNNKFIIVKENGEWKVEDFTMPN